jgi:two-component system response regulator PilR (NtrC family)
LYYRLNVIQIRVPPLRERIEDLPVIVDRVLQRIAADADVSPAPTLTREALVHLSRYAFPGNVRELENLLHRAVALSGEEEIGVADVSLPDAVMNEADLPEVEESSALAARLAPTASAEPEAVQPPAVVPLPDDLERYLDGVEREILIRALERYRFNRTAAGASMGLSLRQMRYRMARLGVSVGEQTGLGDGDRGDRN